MQHPLRLVLLLRPSVSIGILLAIGYSTFVMGSTPFLFDLVAQEYRVGLGLASLIGVLQMGGFVAGSWGAGRWLRPRRRVFVACLVAAVASNLISAFLPPFALLLVLRFVSGLSLGLISWFAWVQVFGDERGMGDVAVMGPLAGVATSPLIARAASQGPAMVFGLLALLAAVPLAWNGSTGAAHRVPARRRRTTPVPAAAVLLACLALFTIGGSAVFQFAVVLGARRFGLSADAVAVALSANAVASIPATKWPWSRGIPGPWMALTAGCAVALTTAVAPWMFVAAMMLWGFAFWMATPGVFAVLAQRSRHPADRAGDAQAVMAAGRVVGPLLGGLVIDGAGTAVLGAAGGGLMGLAAVGVFAVRALIPPRPSEARDDYETVGGPTPSSGG